MTSVVVRLKTSSPEVIAATVGKYITTVCTITVDYTDNELDTGVLTTLVMVVFMTSSPLVAESTVEGVGVVFCVRRFVELFWQR